MARIAGGRYSSRQTRCYYLNLRIRHLVRTTAEKNSC